MQSQRSNERPMQCLKAFCSVAGRSPDRDENREAVAFCSCASMRWGEFSVRQVVFRVRHPLAAIVTSALVIVCKPEMALAQVELEGVTILSTRSERDVYDIPANVTVIDRD